jgi:hypothetical protein
MAPKDLPANSHLGNHPQRALICTALICTALFVLLSAFVPEIAKAQEGLQLKPQAVQQIQLLMNEKDARTTAQQKISSRFLIELATRRGTLDRNALPQLRTHAQVASDDSVLVNITADVDDRLLDRIAELGGSVLKSLPQYRALQARLPLDRLEALAEMESVQSIRPQDRYITQMINTTEGDVAHRADDARILFGVDGTGVQVGAISDSVEELANLQASGDLPPGVTVLPGQAGTGTSEGTALMEIIHDMAPGADLFFATGTSGFLQEMADNITDLAAAGCDVIVDDVLYFSEPVFQDGVIAQAVDAVAANGVQYFSSAGNSGNLTNGTSGTWEGLYSGIALPTPMPPFPAGLLSAHDFGTGNSNLITADPPFVVTVHWANPQGAATDDYDLFLLDGALSTVLDFSTDTQNGTQNPYEEILTNVNDETGNRIVVAKRSGNDVFIHVGTHRGELEQATDGETYGHSAALGAISVAAVNVATAGGGEFTGGAANPIEVFSSDGPRRIFFEANGDPVPATFTATLTHKGIPTGVVRQKPDVAAADGVSTATPGFNPFFGTSASAPHAAGISALFSELFPSVSTPDAYDAFRSSALDVDPFGFDRDSGAGIIDAENALDPQNIIFSDGFESGDTSVWTKTN